VQLSAQELADVRAYVEEELSGLRLDGERERRVQERRLVGLFAERKKLLDAHYADAVPLDLLRSEQERLTREIDSAEGRLAEVEGDFRKAESNLQRALTRVGDCETAYWEAADPLRRQLNLAFFRRLLIDDDYNVSGELAEPFDTLLGPELRRAVAVRASEELQNAVEQTLRKRAAEGVVIENEQHPREPDRPLVGAGSTTGFSSGGGFSSGSLMRMRGLEPPPSYLDTDLNRARLPIPPHPRSGRAKISHPPPRRRVRRGRPGAGRAWRFASLEPAYEPPSSRGLGRRPLTAVTRVRIPLAV
jgi:hypothetical protein